MLTPPQGALIHLTLTRETVGQDTYVPLIIYNLSHHTPILQMDTPRDSQLACLHLPPSYR